MPSFVIIIMMMILNKCVVLLYHIYLNGSMHSARGVAYANPYSSDGILACFIFFTVNLVKE
jgi:hypothetical protein